MNENANGILGNSPATTLQAVVSPTETLLPNQLIVSTSTYTIGQNVYHNVIIEEVDTVTATMTATALGKRAAQHLAHLQRHGRHHQG